MLKYIKDILIIVLGIIITIVVLMVVGNIFKTNVKTPVEENTTTAVIDSLIKNNDSLKIEVNTLEHEKETKVVEVYNLSNDSTIKLFYKLVSE